MTSERIAFVALSLFAFVIGHREGEKYGRAKSYPLACDWTANPFGGSTWSAWQQGKGLILLGPNYTLEIVERKTP